MRLPAKVAIIGRECVACGCCAAVCPREAIHISYGVIAKVDFEKCVGCGLCAKTCPAAIIEIAERRAVQ